MQNIPTPLVEFRNISKFFPVSRGKNLHALSGISLDIFENEILGLIGESGCGKSTLGRTLVRLHTQSEGEIFFDGINISRPFNRAQKKAYSRQVQMIFQDPYSALNPRMIVSDIIAEGPLAHNLWHKSEIAEKVAFWLQKVGLEPAHAGRFPHEFSGGQRQRIGIARALALEPRVIVCDEPISALDVSIQAQVIHLLKELQVERALSYLFVAHDLSMVRIICDRIAVMYSGHIVEVGRASDVYENPQHPYTKGLIAAIPIADPVLEKKRRQSRNNAISGEISSAINPKPGCSFAGRCAFAMERCLRETPVLRDNGKSKVACHLF